MKPNSHAVFHPVLSRTSLAILLGLGAFGAARAQLESSAHASPQAVTLDTVRVDAAPIAPSVASPLGLTLRETPQAVSVLSKERMQEQGIVTARDAMQWMPGISFGSFEESETTSFRSRGYALNNVMVDGVSLSGAASAMSADLSLYEGVEVLRGPAGLYAGNGDSGSPGGVINLTRKRPTAERQVNVSVSAGSWDNYKTTLDVSGALNASKDLRGRAIISHIDRKFFYDNGERVNWTFGGSLDYDLTANTNLRFGADHEHRKARISYWAMARNFDGSAPKHSRSTSSIMPWGGSVFDDYSFFVELKHAFANDWQFKANYTYKKKETDHDYGSVANSNWNALGKDVLHLQSTRSYTDSHSRTFDANLNGHFSLLGRKHEFSTGLNVQSKNSYSPRLIKAGYLLNDTRTGGVNAIVDDSGPGFGYDSYLDFDASLYPYLPSVLDFGQMDARKPTVQSGVYANVRFSLADPLILTAGVRLSNYRYEGRTRAWENQWQAGRFKENGIITPFAALSYDVTHAHTVHISHAEIFEPQNRYDEKADRVKPLLGSNMEVGLKSEWLGGQVQSMLSVYKLERKNDTWRSVDSPCQILLDQLGITDACYVAGNERRTIGVDFEVNGNITDDWSLSFSANWLKHEYTKWKANGGATSSNQGKGWNTNNPTKMAKLWTTWRLPGAARDWRVALGMQMQNKTWTDYNPSTYGNSGVIRPGGRASQGGYTLYNAAVYWAINKSWNAQLNVNNLFDKYYLVQLSGRRLWYGEPRSYNLTLNGRF